MASGNSTVVFIVRLSHTDSGFLRQPGSRFARDPSPIPISLSTSGIREAA